MEVKSPLRRVLFWLDCLGILLLLCLTVGAAPAFREMYEVMDIKQDQLFAVALVSINPVIFAVILSSLLACFVGMQFALDPKGQKHVALGLFLFEIAVAVAYVFTLFLPIFHMHCTVC